MDFNFHGVRARVEADDAAVAERVLGDFRFFETDGTGSAPHVTIRAVREAPDYASLPELDASVYSPRNVSYQSGDDTYIDYFGRALSVYRRATESIEARSTDVDLLHEIVYLTMLSRVSEALEARGLVRVHAMAVASGEDAALMIIPSGGGKTTLALALLQESGLQLVSEDSPLIGLDGSVHPFPLRMGFATEQPPPFETKYLTRIKRMEFEPKWLLSLDALEGRIARTPTRPRFLFLGARTLRHEPAIVPTSRARAMKALLRDMVIGVGLYQGVEFLTRQSPLELVRRTPQFTRRLRAAIALARRSQPFAFTLSRDPAKNRAAARAFLAQHGFGLAR